MFDPVAGHGSCRIEQGQREDQFDLGDTVHRHRAALRMRRRDEFRSIVEVGQGGLVKMQLGRTQMPRCGGGVAE